MRIKIFGGALIVLMLSAVIAFAQGGPGEPCGGTDPDATCPLDSWVMVLAVIAVVFASVHLYRKQKANLLAEIQHKK
jgi:hypothetical protein